MTTDATEAPGGWVFHPCDICGAPIHYEPEQRSQCARCLPVTYTPTVWVAIGEQ